MRVSPIITSFNAGELSPNLAGRTDVSKYPSGCRLIEGFLPIVQGPAVRRAGTRHVAAVKDQAKRVWLVKFEFSATQAYVLEFGDSYVRFYTGEGVLLSGMSPYEIASPYPLADLTNADGTCALRFVQSGDVLYIANLKRTYAPRKLTRIAETNWVFSIYQPNQGPFLESNASATTIYASAQSGTVTLTASAATFSATDVGRLVRLQEQDLDVEPWETDKSYSTDDLVRYDGITYKALNNDTSGTSPPVHDRGSAFDGKSAVQWEYQDPGYGIVRIASFVSATEVTATVVVDADNGLNLLPAGVVGSGNATTRWRLGAWSATTEYPGCVAFFRNRLFWGGAQRLWASVPDDFENMAGDFFGVTRADNAIWTQLQSNDVNEILWLTEGRLLVIGTGGGEHTLGELTTTDPLGPGNVKIEKVSKRRCNPVQPEGLGTSLLYVQRAGRKLLGMDYAIEQDTLVSSDLAILSDRITRTGIVDMAYQGEPYQILWCVLSNGALRGFTYDREQEVSNWSRHPIGGGGIVEAVTTVPTPDGSREQLWLVVRRTINGSTRRYVEFMERPWEGADVDGSEADAQEDAFYVDSGLTYEGAPVTTITGLGHLEGETVQILADGATHPDKVVTAGAVQLDRSASVVQAGLVYPSKLVPMKIESGSPTGTGQGKKKRIHKIVVRFIDTLGGRVGLFGGVLDSISRRTPSTPMGSPDPIEPLIDKEISMPGGWNKDAQIEIQQDQPLPMTVAAIMPEMQVTD